MWQYVRVRVRVAALVRGIDDGASPPRRHPPRSRVAEPALTSSENVPAPSELSPNFQPLARGKLPAFQLAIQSSAFSKPSPAAWSRPVSSRVSGRRPIQRRGVVGDARVQVGGARTAAARSADARRARARCRAETHAGGQRHRAAISERRGATCMRFILERLRRGRDADSPVGPTPGTSKFANDRTFARCARW